MSIQSPLPIRKPVGSNGREASIKPATPRRSRSLDPSNRNRPFSTGITSVLTSGLFMGKPSKNGGGGAIEEEQRSSGAVSFRLYREFLCDISIWKGTLLVLVSVLPQLLFIWANQWLNIWSNQTGEEQQRAGYPILLIVLTVLCTLSSFVRAEGIFVVVMGRCERIFDKMLTRSLQFPLSFFTGNPIGRLLNRFTKDQCWVDEELPWTLFDALQCSLLFLGTLLLVVYLNVWISFMLPPILYLYMLVRRYYLNASREMKRCEAIARSPLISLLNATILGVLTLRSYPTAVVWRSFHEHFIYLQNQHSAAVFAYDATARWLAFYLDMISVLFFFALSQTFIIVLYFTTSYGSSSFSTFSASDAGLALSYAMYLLGLVQWCIRQLSEVENMMTSVERIISYSKLPIENTSGVSTVDECKEGKNILDSTVWPSEGAVTIEHLTLSVPSRPLPILQDISLSIPGGGYRVAIVGRTGAGKSSLLSALLRLIEPDSFSLIEIDGVNITKVSLKALRNAISVIPQDPVLFDATLRFNLDPFQRCSDFELWRALCLVKLINYSPLDSGSPKADDLACNATSNLDSDTSLILPDGLDTDLSGTSLSTGEKQLLCLARALLRQTKLIFMDEATANIDIETSAMIQGLVLTLFPTSTIFTIAHRLQTVIDYDCVVVLEQGKLVEQGSPHELLVPLEKFIVQENSFGKDSADVTQLGFFAKMIWEMGSYDALQMIEMAKKKLEI